MQKALRFFFTLIFLMHRFSLKFQSKIESELHAASTLKSKTKICFTSPSGKISVLCVKSVILQILILFLLPVANSSSLSFVNPFCSDFTLIFLYNCRFERPQIFISLSCPPPILTSVSKSI